MKPHVRRRALAAWLAAAAVAGAVVTVGPGQLTVTPGRPRATGTGANVPVQVSLAVQSARDVLAAPVAALLALAGGGYGLEVVTPSGAYHLVGVITGIFAAGQVQVSGPGITQIAAATGRVLRLRDGRIEHDSGAA